MNDNVYNIGDRRPAVERPLGETIHEAIGEFRVFIEKRIGMLQSELREKAANIRFAAPLLIVGSLLAVSAWLLFTGAIVAVLTVAFAGSPYAAFLALVIAGAVYAAVGAGLLWMAFGRIGKHG